MKKFDLIILFLIFLSFFNQSQLLADEKNYKIIKLVNDQVITNYDLEQRIKLYATLNRTNIDDGNIDQIANNILLIMVDEILQLEKINEYKIIISDSEVENYIQKAYLGTEKNISDLIEVLNIGNIDIKILRDLIRIQLAWNELAGRLYYRTSEINNNDLINIMQDDTTLSEEQAKNILLKKQIELRAKKLLRDIKAEANIETR